MAHARLNHSHLQSLLVVFILLLTSTLLHAQILTTVYSFNGQSDGRWPGSGVVVDRAGNLYGSSSTSNHSLIFRLSHRGTGWTFTPLHVLTQQEGSGLAGLSFGPDGALYGATNEGGNSGCSQNLGCGTLFRLTPPPTPCASILCTWPVTVMHTFTGSPDGGRPWWGAGVIFDRAGNLYGTTYEGGIVNPQCPNGCGVVYKMTRSNGHWNETVLYSFTGPDGAGPQGPVVFDIAGNLYGTTSAGGSANAGTVFRLSPSGSGWVQTTLYSFHGPDGQGPVGALAIDQAGVLYGATAGGGTGSCHENGPCGTVFSLAPANGAWQQTVLYSFGGLNFNGYPQSGVTIDKLGNLYGTTQGYGGPPLGNVYEIHRYPDLWAYQSLHDFTDGSDGACSYSNVSIGPNGKLYGTTFLGGHFYDYCPGGCGTVWEITH